MRAGIVWRLGHGVGGREVAQVHGVVVGGVVGVVGVWAGVTAQRGRGDVGRLDLHLDQGGRLPDEREGVSADTVYPVRRRDGTPELTHAGGGSRVSLALAGARRDGRGRVAQPRARAVRRGRDPRVGRPRLRLDGEGRRRDGVPRRAGGRWRRLLQLRRRLGLRL